MGFFTVSSSALNCRCSVSAFCSDASMFGLTTKRLPKSNLIEWLIIISRLLSYSSIDATTASAAIAAVSARRMRGPSETARQPFASKSASSSGAHPPSGPIAISSAGISSRRTRRLFQGTTQGGGALLLGEHDARLRVRSGTRCGERHRIGDERNIGAAGLLRCLMRDAAPSLRALPRSLREMLFAAARNNRRDRRDTEFGGLFDRPFHVIELVDSHYQRNGQRGLGLGLGDEVEADLAVGDGGHLGMKDTAAGDHIGLHAGLRAQHAAQVFGLRANQSGGCFIPVFGDPASARHIFGIAKSRYSCAFSIQSILRTKH